MNKQKAHLFGQSLVNHETGEPYEITACYKVINTHKITHDHGAVECKNCLSRIKRCTN